MNKILIAAALALGLAAEVLAAGASWWDKAYAFRVPLTVNSLFNKRKDTLVRAKADFAALLLQAGGTGKLDLDSIRLVEMNGQGQAAVVPCQFNSTDGASGDVCWTLAGKTEPLAERRYFLYFDSLEHGPKPKPEPVVIPGASLPPGGNRLKNSSFEDPDPKEPRHAAGWDFGQTPFESACRTDEESHSGKYSLKIVTTAAHLKGCVAVSQRVPVTGAKRYLVRGWMKCRKYEGGACGVWAWYGFDQPVKNIGNYKTTAGGRASDEWTPFSATWINIYDGEIKEDRSIPATLPGTTCANVQPSAYYGEMVVYFDDIEFIELDPSTQRQPVDVAWGKAEKSQ